MWRLKRFLEEEEGVQLAEEALMLVLIAMVSIGILGTLASNVLTVFTDTGTAMSAL